MSLIIPMFLQEFCRHFPLNDVIILLYHITTCFQTVGNSLPQSEHMTQIGRRRIVHVQGSTYNWLGNPSNLPYFPMRNTVVNPSWLRRGYIRRHAIGRMLTATERGAIYQDSCICRLGRDAVTIWHAYIGSRMR